MKLAKYFWDLNPQALMETSRALKNPEHPQFAERMVTLLTRCDQPKELFSAVPKETFLKAWPKIRSAWIKRIRQSDQRSWWETMYEQLAEAADKKNLPAKGEPSVHFAKFGMLLKAKRLDAGLSQSQLAKRTGLAQPVISQIEEGRKNITLLTLIRLCKVLDIKTLEIG